VGANARDVTDWNDEPASEGSHFVPPAEIHDEVIVLDFDGDHGLSSLVRACLARAVAALGRCKAWACAFFLFPLLMMEKTRSEAPLPRMLSARFISDCTREHAGRRAS
jgi:hypothetical protein